MAEDTWKHPSPGDLLWQSRMPGGVCIFMGLVTIETSKHDSVIWTEKDQPVYLILHPQEGLVEDPSYYYMTLEEEEKYSRRRLKYELQDAGHPVPDWLQKEIEKDETR